MCLVSISYQLTCYRKHYENNTLEAMALLADETMNRLRMIKVKLSFPSIHSLHLPASAIVLR